MKRLILGLIVLLLLNTVFVNESNGQIGEKNRTKVAKKKKAKAAIDSNQKTPEVNRIIAQATPPPTTETPAEEVAEAPRPKKDRPVMRPFESSTLMESQSSVVNNQGAFEMIIQHKFSEWNNYKNLFGIMSPGANIRMAGNYTIIKNLQLGLGVSMGVNGDLNIKYSIPQTRKNSMPVSITFYGLGAVDFRDKEVFGANYNFMARMSSYALMMIGRKVNDWFSIQAGASYGYYNFYERGVYNDAIGLNVNGKLAFAEGQAFVFSYEHPFVLNSIFPNPPQPNISLGYEVATATHTFHIFASHSKGLLPQDILVKSTNKVNDFAMYRLGFTISRIWN